MNKHTHTRSRRGVQLEAVLATALVAPERVDAVLKLVAQVGAFAALVYIC